ncbi:MAG: 30S ribosomal protein S12 methylthiotransferase RimO [Lachnospiraceae bacterium]|nr:30S ribosomal protein S12 methylthiotransferase RimO [Lachnospiraceae bacterium]
MKLFFVSLGCDKNTVDSEHMIAKLSDYGYTLTDDENEADVIVINTCCFIHDAKQESIDTILEMARQKERGRLKSLIVCGCLAKRYKDEILQEIPEVDAVVGSLETDDIAEAVNSLHNISQQRSEDTKRPRRFITTPGHYEYLKIAEGCDKNCTYCVIPKLRGPYRSVPMEELIREAEELADAGVKELILVAQHTTMYGTDIYGRRALPELLCKLSDIEGIQWIRLLYAYPEDITDELIEVMSTNPKICHYIDMPVQSGSDDVLRRMGRHTDTGSIREVVKKLRDRMDDICIRTTLITGFPGETQADHEDTYRFVNEMEFDRLGVFTYSAEEGTPACDFDGQISEEMKAARRDELYVLQQAVSYEVSHRLIGRKMTVTVDGYLPEDEVYVARSYRDAPDIDGFVFIHSRRELMTGDMVTVRIEDATEYDLEGELTDESA